MRRSEANTARSKLESAISSLLYRAKNYDGPGGSVSSSELLSAAREYGRALRRIETLRKA